MIDLDNVTAFAAYELHGVNRCGNVLRIPEHDVALRCNRPDDHPERHEASHGDGTVDWFTASTIRIRRRSACPYPIPEPWFYADRRVS